MERAWVTCVWTAGRSFDLPALPAEASVMDVTGQSAVNVPTDPNVLVVEVWAPAAYLNSLPAGSVLWREPYAS